jgi:Tfp pilus assembly protein PilX
MCDPNAPRFGCAREGEMVIIKLLMRRVFNTVQTIERRSACRKRHARSFQANESREDAPRFSTTSEAVPSPSSGLCASLTLPLASHN